MLKTYPGDIELKDDDGKDICLNIDFNQDILHTVLESIHQRAIDLALKVIEKNNLTKKNLDAVILVGGPTLSPVFQKMIKTEISDKIDTSVNPMTIVAKGAALFASTKDAITGPGGDEEVVLDINYETATLEKDTLINNINYFKVIRPEVLGSSFNDKFVRDSLHYLVNSVGQIIFSSQNFTDTFYSYFVTASLTDTICKVLVKMDDKNLSVSTPAGQFQTSSFKQNYIMYPNWANYGNTRQLDTRYAENIGIISETFPFYASDPNYVQRRLVRYKVN